MKKLMTMIAAVATAFGLFAADPDIAGINSFDTLDAGIVNGKFTLPTTGWSYTGADTEFDLGEYDGDAYAYPTTTVAGNIRRTEFPSTKNENFLTLATGKEVLSLAANDKSIFADQVVKFTGFEEAPDLADNTKIAVWMSEEWNDDDTVAVTNLYVSAYNAEEGVTNYLVGAANQYELGKWYRLTIKNVGDILKDGGRLGFVVFIDGVPASSEDAKNIILEAQLKDQATIDLQAAGQLFPAITTDATFASVGYMGIGSVDDVLVDDQGPEFARKIPFTVAGNKMLAIDTIKDSEGNDVVPSEGVANGTKVIVTWAPNAGYKILGDKKTTEMVITEQGQTITPDDDIDVQEVVATVNGTDDLAKSELYTAFAALTAGDWVDIVKNCDVTNGEEAVLYSFTRNTWFDVGATGWDVFVGNINSEIAGSMTVGADIAAGATLAVTFENGEDGTLTLESAVVAGTLEVTNGTTYVAGDGDFGGIAVAGSVKAANLNFLNDYFVLAKDATVITTDGTIDTDPLEGCIVAADGLEITITGPVDGYYTYTAVEPAPKTGFMVIIAGEPTQVDTLAEAIEKADANSTITFLSDATVDTLLTVNKNLTFDLDGNDLTGPGGKTFEIIDDATLTVNAEDSTITGVRFNVGKRISSGVGNDGALVLNGGSYSITDNTIVHVNGDCAACEVTITDATLVSNGDNGVQFNGKGTYAINNSTISGATAIYMKGGTLTIDKDCEIVATAATYTAPKADRDGSWATGDAIVMDSNTAYKGDISLTIASGATVTKTATDASLIRETITAGDESTTVKINAGGITDIALTPDFAKKVAEGTAELPGFVAVAGGKPYATLAAAVAAAQTTDTVALLADVTLTETLEITKTTTIDLAGKTVTFAANLSKGINAPEAESLVISNGKITVADDRANIGYSRAIYLLHNTSVVFKDLTLDLPGFEYVLNKDCDLAPISDCWDKTLACALVCDNVAINGNGSLFHIENAIATLKDCATTWDSTLASFGGAHEAAIYSSCGAVTTVDGGIFTAPNALQTGDLGGTLIVNGGEFTGDIKSFMGQRVSRGADEWEQNLGKITITAGTFDGDFVEVVPGSDKMIWDIKGGSFTADPTAYVAEGYAAIKDGDVWNVGEAIIANFTVDGAIYAAETNIVAFTPAQPADPVKTGYTFTGWLPAIKEISETTEFVAQFTLDQEYGGGDGSEAHPFIIETADHFVELQTKVGAGNAYAGKFFKLTDNVTLTDWEGIGQNDNHGDKTKLPFSGVFNGNGKTITVSFKGNKKYAGFFNYLTGGAVVSNVTFDVSLGTIPDATAEFGVGAVAGKVVDATIEKVTVNGTSLGTSDTPLTHTVGALVVLCEGGASLFKDCVNNVDVYSTGSKVGGFIGSVNSGVTVTLENCVNNGDIGTSDGQHGVAGFIGFAQGTSYANFADCENTGTITGVATSKIGSLVGKLNSVNNYASGTGTNTAQDDILAVGYDAGVEKVTDLNFATVDGNVATIVADDALALNGSYKVMAPNATPMFEFTEAGTIAFDEALVAVKSFDGITAVAPLELTSKTDGTVTTFTAAAPGPVYPDDWPKTDDATKAKFLTWAAGKGAGADLSTDAAKNAFLLNCTVDELEAEKAAFKITKIEKVDGEWVITVKSENTKGAEFNGKVVTKAFEEVGCETVVPNPAGSETELFWKAFLVFPAAE